MTLAQLDANSRSPDEKVLVAYSFMAALNNRGIDLFQCVYMPLFKRAMSEYAKQSPGGKDIDIKKMFLDMYGIDVPIYSVRLMLKTLNKRCQAKRKNKHRFHSTKATQLSRLGNTVSLSLKMSIWPKRETPMP